MDKRLLCVLIVFMCVSGCNKRSPDDLVKYVNPLIGTAYKLDILNEQLQINREDFGQVIPAVTSPFGMTQWTPQTNAKEQKCVPPFYGSIRYLQGFRASHWLSGSCSQDYGSFTFMPIDNVFNVAPRLRRSFYEIQKVTSTPSYLSAMLTDYNIFTEITSTKRAGFFRFSWAFPEKPYVVIDINSDKGQGYIKIDAERNEIFGYNPVHRIYNGEGQPAGFNGYFVARFNVPLKDYGTFSGMEYFKGQTEASGEKNMGGYTSFEMPENNVVLMKVGTSFTSIENARKNLDTEIPHWDFSKTEAELREIWNNLLKSIYVEGGEEDDFIKFYTAIYHSCMQPRLFSDANGDYIGFNGDSTIYKAEDFDYYCDFSAWDTYRAQMPLVSLIAPQQYEDMLRSLIIKAENGGWMPTSPMWNCYTSAMIGDHASTIICDAYLKGFDVDIEKAWPYLEKNAFETPENIIEYADGKGRRALESYMEYGYIPLEDEINDTYRHGGQVSMTLEYAYNDWVLAQVAKKLGKEEVYQNLIIRAENYANVYDPDKGWVCGRLTNGYFTPDFDKADNLPYITETSPMEYTFFAPQNIPGLMETMGGDDVFSEKLHNLFENNQYRHGHVIAHHIPYLFNFTDNWQKTQETVKNILHTKYGTTSLGGLTGNEKAGQVSAWYVFSAMGFYPLCPGSNEYQLSSPIFNKIVLILDKNFYPGGKFTIKAKGENYSVFNKVKLNGKNTGYMLSHESLKKGGRLVFYMDE